MQDRVHLCKRYQNIVIVSLEAEFYKATCFYSLVADFLAFLFYKNSQALHQRE